jgi:hypothetical protein
MPHDVVTGKVAPQPFHHPSLTASSIPHGRCASLMTPGVGRVCRWDGRFSLPVEGGALPRSQPCPRFSSTRRNTARKGRACLTFTVSPHGNRIGGWVLGHHDHAQVRRRGLHQTGDVDRWRFVLLGKRTSIAMREVREESQQSAGHHTSMASR